MILEQFQRRLSTLEKQRVAERKQRGRPYVPAYPMSLVMLDDDSGLPRMCACGDKDPIDMKELRVRGCASGHGCPLDRSGHALTSINRCRALCA